MISSLSLFAQLSVQVFVPVCSRVATKVWGIHRHSPHCRNSKHPQLITMLAPPAVVTECSSHAGPTFSFKWTCISATVTLLYFSPPSTSTCTFSPLPQFYATSIWHVFRHRHTQNELPFFLACLSIKRRVFANCFVCLWSDVLLLYVLRISGAVPLRSLHLMACTKITLRFAVSEVRELEYKIAVFWALITFIGGGGFLHSVWTSHLHAEMVPKIPSCHYMLLM